LEEVRMKNFEGRLEKLEELGTLIRKPDLPLDEALRAFEEGIKLARSLEKDLEKVESRIEVLKNSPEAGTLKAEDDKLELGLFDEEF
jgi:exodeoxyribonuclease VII small subunit